MDSVTLLLSSYLNGAHGVSRKKMDSYYEPIFVLEEEWNLLNATRKATQNATRKAPRKATQNAK